MNPKNFFAEPQSVDGIVRKFLCHDCVGVWALSHERRSFVLPYYAIVGTADGHDLNELLVNAGLTRIYGTRTPLPDGRDSLTYLAHLHELENEARAAKRGAWGKVHR